MAAGLVLPIAGPYSGTFNALPLGVQNDDGFELAADIPGQEIRETDAYGLTLTEAIARGMNWRCRFRGLEWNRTGLLSILQMFGQSGAVGSFTPILTNIGQRWTSFCQPLVLTSILVGFPPATPASLTATNAGFGPNSQSAFNMTSKAREFPLEMVLIPYQTVILGVTYNVPFTTS